MKTIARVYDTYGQARQVVADLEASGIAASDINLIANKYVCDESAAHPRTVGRRARPPASAPRWAARQACWPASASSPSRASVRSWRRVRWLRPRSAPLPAPRPAAWSARWSSAGVPEPEAQVYCEAVRRGGTMVSVHAADDEVGASSASWIVTSRSIRPSAARSIPAKAGSASIRRPRPTRRARPRSTVCAVLT